MVDLTDKWVVVVGLCPRGRAAARLLQRQGARVVALDSRDTPVLREATVELRALGLPVRLGASRLSGGPFELAVVSPGEPRRSALVRSLQARGVPLISELELAYRLAHCLWVAVGGTNGKSTTAALVGRMLTQAQRTVVVAGGEDLPASRVVERSRDLDYAVVTAGAAQLEWVESFRPVVGVLTNLSAPGGARDDTVGDHVRVGARLLAQQQAFDWAVVQLEALAQLQTLGVRLPGKGVTFSARSRRADLYLDRGLLVSRLSEWEGPILDLAQTRFRGAHQAEDALAALAVGRILRLPLESMVEALRTFVPLPDRCEGLGEVAGVQYYNDARAGNLEATRQAIAALSVSAALPSEPNLWLIAGGDGEAGDYHDLGPLLAQKVKGAILYGPSAEKLRAAWGLFTPCTVVSTLLEALSMAAANAVAGEVVLFSPACSSPDMFTDAQRWGEVFRRAVTRLGTTTGGGVETLDAIPSGGTREVASGLPNGTIATGMSGVGSSPSHPAPGAADASKEGRSVSESSALPI